MRDGARCKSAQYGALVARSARETTTASVEAIGAQRATTTARGYDGTKKGRGDVRRRQIDRLK